MIDFWFNNKKADFKSLVDRYEALKKEQTSDFQNQIMLYEDFYENKNIPAYAIQDLASSHRGQFSSYNLIRSITNTLQSRIGSKQPKPMFLTDNAKYETQKKTKMNDRIVNYHFKHGGAYKAGKQCFKLACISNIGAVKVLEDRKKQTFKYEPVHPLKFFVPTPRFGLTDRDEIFQEYRIPKSTLIEMYPDYKEEILKNIGLMNTRHNSIDYSEDDGYSEKTGCLVVECWKSNKKHCVFVPDIDNLILFEEDWKFDFIPFEFYRWETRTEGFFGQGLAEELTPIQRRVNYITRKIINSIDLVAGSKIFVSGKIENHNSKLTNQIGAIYRYSGEQPPFESMFQGVPESYFMHLRENVEMAFKQSGISELSVQTLKPKGLNSGKALQTYNDIETQRFASASRDYSQLFIGLAKITYEMGVHFGFPMFKKISEKEKPYIDIYPTNLLSEHPSARYDDLEKLISMGVVPVNQVTQLLNFPDLESFETSEGATIKAVRDLLNRITELPEDDANAEETPIMELDLLVQLEVSKKVLADLVLLEAKDYQIKRVRNFINIIKEEINNQVQPSLPSISQGVVGGEQTPSVPTGVPSSEGVQTQP